MQELHFSIDGNVINNLAREKLWEYNDFAGAMDLIMSATQIDGDVPYAKERQIFTALAILDGTYEIRGVYPGKDYGVYPAETRPEQTLKDWFAQVKTRLEEADEEKRRMADKIACIASSIDEYKMVQIDADWRSDWADEDDPDRTIFGTSTQDQIQAAMLDDLKSRMTSEVDEPDYGWLFPDGTFYPVEWGDHQGWAWKWLMDNDPDFRKKAKSDNMDDMSETQVYQAGDWLSKHHRAILLHNPAMGTANVTGIDISRITKAQREWLYDYYTKRGLTEKANELYQD